MKNQNDELVFEGESMHCFLNAEGKPIRMKKEFPDLYHRRPCPRIRTPVADPLSRVKGVQA